MKRVKIKLDVAEPLQLSERWGKASEVVIAQVEVAELFQLSKFGRQATELVSTKVEGPEMDKMPQSSWNAI